MVEASIAAILVSCKKRGGERESERAKEVRWKSKRVVGTHTSKRGEKGVRMSGDKRIRRVNVSAETVRVHMPKMRNIIRRTLSMSIMMQHV